MTRKQVMELHEIKGDRLKRHSKLSRAYVYTPIEDFTLDDVWTYLLQVDNPWGNNNRNLASLYKTAQSDECPLVIDETTPSCGNSRFGCWTCTVVEDDKSMSNMIDDGEDWMQPLFELRNKLKETQDPERKKEVRDPRRLDGTVKFKDNSKEAEVSPGPYKLEFCKEILRDVLEAQEYVREHGPDPNETLIEEEELHKIRQIWRNERQDWEDSLPKIYKEVTGEKLAWAQDDAAYFGQNEKELLKQVSKDEELPPQLVMKLIDVEKNLQGMSRRANIFNKIDVILDQEWRTIDEVREEYIENQKEIDANQELLNYQQNKIEELVSDEA